MVPVRRPLGPSILLGVVVGVTVAAVALIFVALPLFFLARAADPARGTGRPFISTGLRQVAIPFGVVAGVPMGMLAGRWYRRGGRLAEPDGQEPEDQVGWRG
jgi:hypothetical protein